MELGPVPRLRRQRAGRGAAAAVPAPVPAFDRGWRRDVDAYSRRVALLRRLLPALGLGLLLLVAAWPRLEPLLENMRFNFPAIDRRDARELRMINPRYAGIDRFDRPYVLSAAAGAQMPGHNDLMSLDRPRGQIIAHGGVKVVLTSATGIYQAPSKLLDLFGDVTLTHSNGTRFVTQAAHLDLARETADGHDPVAGRGPSGAITAQGFRILDKGDTIVFTGHAHLLLLRIALKRAMPPPPALPPPVEQAAVEIAAAAAKAAATIAAPPPGSGPALTKPRPAPKREPSPSPAAAGEMQSHAE
jgi:lipopolysaccharide export system protein LptC